MGDLTHRLAVGKTPPGLALSMQRGLFRTAILLSEVSRYLLPSTSGGDNVGRGR
jgi:hypothetical protein